jgi:hypothetical protein
MFVYATFATRPYSKDEPELVEAWDEFSIDANPEGYSEAVKKALDAMGEDLHEHRTVRFRVNYPELIALFWPKEINVKIEAVSDERA